jgi:hypothetical protein
MAHFKYNGSDNFKDDDLTLYGVEFEKGEVSEVTNEYAIAKFRGHPHFMEAFEEVEEPTEPKKRKPGRPRLTDEEKAARAEAKRQEAAAIQTDLGPNDAWDEDANA